MRGTRVFLSALCFYAGYTWTFNPWVALAWSFSGCRLFGGTPAFGTVPYEEACAIREDARALARKWGARG